MSSDGPVPVAISVDVDPVDLAGAVEVAKVDERSRVAQFLRELVAAGRPVDVGELIATIESGELVIPEAAESVPAEGEVASLLRQSWAEHNAAKALRGQRVGPGVRRPHIERAYSLRQRAHELDPEHRDVSWQAEAAMTVTGNGQSTHDSVLAFYRQQLGIA